MGVVELFNRGSYRVLQTGNQRQDAGPGQKPADRPRLLSDNGSSYIAGKWLNDRNIKHLRGAPYHSMTQGKIERRHQTLKNRFLLENYFLPGDLVRAALPDMQWLRLRCDLLGPMPYLPAGSNYRGPSSLSPTIRSCPSTSCLIR
jgi:transposase InsO family protein